MGEIQPVTLKVKAPNNKIEDQVIQCESSWTVDKLKLHLSEVYPSKPAKEDQKLIYSGQLLQDSLVLRDVLRQYDGQEMHTLHLVCTTLRDTFSSQNQNQQKMESPSRAVPPVANNSAVPPMQIPEQQPQPPPPPGDMDWPSFYDHNQYAIHMAYMHQAYVQYLAQYMNMTGNRVAEQVVGAEVPEPPEVVEEQPREAGEGAERDWLDWFYVLSRLMLLFSIVYFYSSPIRFIAVLFCGIILYLYQGGFFRHQINNNNNENNNIPAGEQAAAATNETPERQQPQPFTLCLRFFVTFFASLIPEIPNAV